MRYTIEEAKRRLAAYRGRPLRIMEVCGTHTHEIFRLGLRSLLPEQVQMISGPGCPVCVTPVSFIDEARSLALEKGVTVATFGDLLRVPGSEGTLAQAKAQGADVRMVYSPFDALEAAKKEPRRQVVFLSVGFETTTPGEALAVQEALRQGVANFFLLTANKTMPAAYEALRGSADAFLYPGHVHAIIGTQVCERLRREQGVSGVVAGFTAGELLSALAALLDGAERGEPFFYNEYENVAHAEGNPAAQRTVEEVMEPCDARWRGLGVIAGSGLRLREEYAAQDAARRFALGGGTGRENPACRCGEVLRGAITPRQCPLFGRGCTPEHPVGACMVSGEGACAAFFLYGAPD